jgi:hypothetical protein
MAELGQTLGANYINTGDIGKVGQTLALPKCPHLGAWILYYPALKKTGWNYF